MKLRGMLLAAVAFGAPVLDGCNSDPTRNQTVEGVAGGGQINMQLRLPDGASLPSISYEIDHTNGYSNDGSVNLERSTTPRFQVGKIPAGLGYSIALRGTTSAGVVCSSDPRAFDIVAGSTTAVTVALRCGTNGTSTVGATSGNVLVNVDVTQGQNVECPTVDGITALPLEIIVGNPISLTGYATLPTATFSWSVAPAGGAFSAATAASTTYTPAAVGTQIVTLSVTGAAGCPTYTDTVQVTSSADPTAVDAGVPDADVPDADVPDTSVPDTSVPDTSVPDTSVPDTSVPDTSVPDTSVPDTSVPDTSVPDTSVPDTSVPDTSVPDTSVPDTSVPDAGSACELCLASSCRDVLGVDMFAGCFTAVNPEFGAPTSDPAFIQDCINAVQCTARTGCGFTQQFQAAECYCGTNSGDACTTAGPALNAPCLNEWRIATRVAGDEANPAAPTPAEIAADNANVQLRFSDLAYPAGWAYFLIDCTRDNCATVCDPTP